MTVQSGGALHADLRVNLTVGIYWPTDAVLDDSYKLPLVSPAKLART